MNTSSYNQRPSFEKTQRLYYAIVFSICVHLGLLLYKFGPLLTEKTVEFQAPEQLIELSELPKQLPSPQNHFLEPQSNQVVETEDAKNRELDPNATLLSDKNQTAERQSRAQKTDAFKSGQGTGAKAGPLEEAPSETDGESDSLSLGLNETPKQKRKALKDLSLKDLSLNGDGNPVSASDDYLPNVAAGDRTILSTREFRYFSYYNRIKDLLRQHWKPSVEREVAKLWGKGQMLKENELVTRLLVLLDKTGQIQRISKVGASGISEIDEVAVQAFYHAGPFPNPPTGLVEADGYVRINWDFILQTAAAPQIQFRPQANSPRFR
ncbi:energy transducer TonB [bacterium]|nr:energy transducer TonB [bacterium]